MNSALIKILDTHVNRSANIELPTTGKIPSPWYQAAPAVFGDPIEHNEVAPRSMGALNPLYTSTIALMVQCDAGS